LEFHTNSLGKSSKDPIEIEKDQDAGDELVDALVRMSESTYSGIQSAITFLYREAGVKVPEEVSTNLSVYMKGSKRLGKGAKQALGLSLAEGKKPMTLQLYRKICEWLFTSPDPEHLFAHLFLVLDWNLMKRAENCQGAMISHITICEDCICFHFAKSKGHQDGEGSLGPWHLYANPFEPYTCAYLAMARYLMTFPDVLKNNSPLFPGSEQYSRYSRIFNALLKDHEVELKGLGYEPDDLGSHSARKGVATQCTAGTTVSPPLVSVCLRMGWTLIGTCQGRYLKYEQAGDRYLGRVAAGLDINSKHFAVSSYYFEPSLTDGKENDEITQAKVNDSIDLFLKDRISSQIDGRTWSLMKSLLAAVCYHYDYIEQKVHPQNLFKSSSFVKDLTDDIRKYAKVSLPWAKTKNAPYITGIPPHVILLAEIEELHKKYELLKTQILDGIATMLDERAVGTPEYYHRQVLVAIQEATEKMTHEIQKSRTVDLNIAVNDSTQSDEFFENSAYFMEDEFDLVQPQSQPALDSRSPTVHQSQPALDSRSPTVQVIGENENRIRTATALKKRRYKVGMFKGKLQVLSSAYKFPKQLSSFQLFSNWFIGNLKSNTPPLRTLKCHHVGHVPGGKDTLRKMGQFMKKVESFSASLDDVRWPERSEKVQTCDVTRLWEKIGPVLFLKYGKDGQSRNVQLSWRTMLNQIRAKDKKR